MRSKWLSALETRWMMKRFDLSGECDAAKLVKICLSNKMISNQDLDLLPYPLSTLILTVWMRK